MQVLAHRLQGADSSFSLYIQNLPVGVSGIPMFFPRDALRAIEYAPVTQQVHMRCQWLLHFAREALQPLPATPADPFLGTSVDANALGKFMTTEDRMKRQGLVLGMCKQKLVIRSGFFTACWMGDAVNGLRYSVLCPGY